MLAHILFMPAARKHRENFAFVAGGCYALERECDVALRHHGAKVKWTGARGVVLVRAQRFFQPFVQLLVSQRLGESFANYRGLQRQASR